MNRLVSLPLIFRQIQLKQCNIHSSKRNLSYTTRILTQNLTSNLHSEFRKQKASGISVQNRLIPNSLVIDNFQWRNYSSNKPPSNRNDGSSAASGGNDGDFDDEIDDWTDEETEDKPKTIFKSVPSTNTVPDFFPKVPMIATAYPVFPKFMKVFEVCGFLLFFQC